MARNKSTRAASNSERTPSSAGMPNDSGGTLDPELAQHLAESMRAQMAAAPPAQTGVLDQPGAAVSNGDAKRHRHEHGHDQFVAHSRPGHEAAVTAVHRTSRPQMKHSS